MDYLKTLTANYPDIHFTCTGDPSVYENISFHGQSIPQVDLDSEWLSLYKKMRNKKINERTQELCLSGFIWNGIDFSTSETAQRNWMALYQFQNILEFPKTISTKDDGSYDIADVVEAQNFVGYCLGVIEARYGSGVVLRNAVNAASSVAEVDAVEDNR